MAETCAKMEDHSARMATNNEIISRYDEILCDKVSKMQLVEVEAKIDRTIKTLTTQLADLDKHNQSLE